MVLCRVRTSQASAGAGADPHTQRRTPPLHSAASFATVGVRSCREAVPHQADRTLEGTPGADMAGLGTGSQGHRIGHHKLSGSAKLFSWGAPDAPLLACGGAPATPSTSWLRPPRGIRHKLSGTSTASSAHLSRGLSVFP